MIRRERMDDKEIEVGDTGYLKEPKLGYYHIEVIGFEDVTGRLIVRLPSGYETTIYEDELDKR